MTSKIISTLPKNDHSCDWIKQPTLRLRQLSLSGVQQANLVVIGSGFKGLATAFYTDNK